MCHFIRVFTVCNTTRLGVSHIKRVNVLAMDFLNPLYAGNQYKIKSSYSEWAFYQGGSALFSKIKTGTEYSGTEMELIMEYLTSTNSLIYTMSHPKLIVSNK